MSAALRAGSERQKSKGIAHGNSRYAVGAGPDAGPALAEEETEAASPGGKGLFRPAGGAQRRKIRQPPGDPVRGAHGHLVGIQRAGQPLRPLPEGAGHRPRRCGEPPDGEPHRVPRRPDRGEQAGGHQRTDQHQPQGAAAGALHQHHRLQGMRIRRGTDRSAGRREGRPAAPRRQRLPVRARQLATPRPTGPST